MLKSTREGTTLVLTLDRPEARNAISRALASALVEAVEEASQDTSVKAVVLGSSHEAVFVAGGDLRELARLPFDERGAEAVLELGSVTRAIETAAIPVVAALGGAALGGGAELTVACDLIVMTGAARVQFVHSRMGLVPAWGGLTRLEERVGRTRASELLLTGRAVGAAEAVSIGLANREVVDAFEGALALAAEAGRASREALVAIKRAGREARDQRRGTALEAERAAFRRSWGSPQHRAAFEALRSP